MGQGGKIYYKHIDDLGRLDMNSRTAAERVTVEWLKERVEPSENSYSTHQGE